MSHRCCFVIPPHISRALVDSPDCPDDIKGIHRATLEHTHGLRSARFQQCNAVRTLGEQGRSRTIVPPQIHQAIAQAGSAEEQDAAVRTLQHDTEGRAARPAKPVKPNRTIYDAKNDDNPSDLPGDVVLRTEGSAPVPSSTDATNDPNECYEGFGDTFKLFSDIFKRNSIDDKGAKLIGTVHFGVKYQNAFWDGRQMVFGDGDGKIFKDFTSRNDVIGHELTHAVTQFTANLDYENQPGALNESVSDVFGIMVKQYKLNQTAEQSNWLLAEGIWGPTIKGRALRDMKNPGTAYNDPMVGKDPQPATMADFKQLPNTDEGDYGGVHINSGIPNKAFYLACTKIGGKSWETAGPIWYKTLTGGKLKSNATFQEFADLTVADAGQYATQVTAAWKEVGIDVKSQREEL